MWKHAGGKHYLTKQANQYYSHVRGVVALQAKVVNINCDIEVRCVLNPPDKRRRDLDNAWKVIADSLTKAGVWQDDKFIRKLTLEWGEVRPGGTVAITVAPRDAESVTC